MIIPKWKHPFRYKWWSSTVHYRAFGELKSECCKVQSEGCNPIELWSKMLTVECRWKLAPQQLDVPHISAVPHVKDPLIYIPLTTKKNFHFCHDTSKMFGNLQTFFCLTLTLAFTFHLKIIYIPFLGVYIYIYTYMYIYIYIWSYMIIYYCITYDHLCSDIASHVISHISYLRTAIDPPPEGQWQSPTPSLDAWSSEGWFHGRVEEV